MTHRNALVAETRRVLRHGLPLIAAQVLSIANGLVDTLVAGRLGPNALGAVAVGAGVIFFVTIAGIGLMAALSPTMAALRGQGRRAEVGVVFRQGVWMALAFGLAGFLLAWWVRHQVGDWGIDPALLPSLHAYLDAIKWSLPPAILLLAARNVCEATGRTRQVLLVQIAGVVINAVANVVLGLGVGLARFGFEPLGISGIAWSTVIVQLSTCAVLYAVLRQPTFTRFALYRPMERPNTQHLRKLLALSAPIALTLLAEAGLFLATAIQMAQFGVVKAGAHNIAITMTAVFYMLPLGLSFALTARVGTAFGRGWWPGVRLRVVVGLLVATGFSVASAIVLVVFREPITAMFTADANVATLATHLLLLAAVFQISDGLQASLLGLLRGLQDTRLPMLINIFSYWGVGFGVGWTAANVAGFGPAGLWFGLIAGLSVSAGLQGWRLRKQVWGRAI